MITSESNAQMKELCKLQKNHRYRKKAGCFVVEGLKLVREAARFGTLLRIYVSEELSEQMWQGKTEQEMAEEFMAGYPALQEEEGTVPEKGLLMQEEGGTVPEEGLLMQEEGGTVPEEGLLMQEEGGTVPEKGLLMQEEGDAARKAGAIPRLEIVSGPVFQKISDTVTPQGILGVVRMPSYPEKDFLASPDGLYLLLDDIRDPGNLGTILRTAEGAGVAGVILSKGCADLFSPKTVRSTMGSVFRLPFLLVDDLAAWISVMQEQGIPVYGTMMEGSEIYYQMDYRGRTGIVIGNEANGISAAVSERLSGRIRIPMAGKTESLNAAVAAAVIVYEAARQQNTDNALHCYQKKI